jgi:hypothetical protein
MISGEGIAMRTFTCSYCRRLLPANPRIKDQHYCSQASCQRARRRKWQRRKMADDPDYQANQREAQRQWQKRNPDYWRTYRRRKSSPAKTAAGNAKMDTLSPKLSIHPGKYMLVPILAGGVKMDALPVKIIPLSMR